MLSCPGCGDLCAHGEQVCDGCGEHLLVRQGSGAPFGEQICPVCLIGLDEGVCACCGRVQINDSPEQQALDGRALLGARRPV